MELVTFLAGVYVSWAIGNYWWAVTAGRAWWPLRGWGWRDHLAVWLWPPLGELWINRKLIRTR